jgi:hypothetical protein
MTRKPLKLFAYASFAVLALGLSSKANAQSETLNATLATSSAIDTVVVTNLDFGEFLVRWVTPDTPTLTLSSTGAVTTTIAGVVNSTIVQITAPANRGEVTVEIPAGNVIMDLNRSAITDFTDAALTLSSVTYTTATQTVSAAIPASPATAPVTVVAADTPESILIGGVIDISGIPVDNAAHTASFSVTLAY